jgi:hypothetical protein
MKLIIKREQSKGFKGVKFKLNVRTELTEEEKQLVNRYGMHKIALHDKEAHKEKKPFSNLSLGGQISRIVIKKLFLDITIGKLIDGVSFSIKSIDDILEHEQSIREACEKFKIYLETMKSFGGEEIVDYN